MAEKAEPNLDFETEPGMDLAIDCRFDTIGSVVGWARSYQETKNRAQRHLIHLSLVVAGSPIRSK